LKYPVCMLSQQGEGRACVDASCEQLTAQTDVHAIYQGGPRQPQYSMKFLQFLVRFAAPIHALPSLKDFVRKRVAAKSDSLTVFLLDGFPIAGGSRLTVPAHRAFASRWQDAGLLPSRL
jgi:hypothetical protein